MFGFSKNKYRGINDEDLLKIYRENQKSAVFTELYLRYGHLVMGTTMNYLKNVQDAEDLTMVIFEKLPERILSHSINNFKSWLYMVTKNECLMLLRKKKIKELEISSDLLSEDIEDPIQLKEIKLCLLEETIDTLNQLQKQCIKLFFLEGKSYQEISIQLSTDINKVKSAIQNGKRNLKLKLEKRNEFQ